MDNNEILFQKIFILFDLAALQSVSPFGSEKSKSHKDESLCNLPPIGEWDDMNEDLIFNKGNQRQPQSSPFPYPITALCTVRPLNFQIDVFQLP